MRRRSFLQTIGQMGGLSIMTVGLAGCIDATRNSGSRNSGNRDPQPPPMEDYLDETDQWENDSSRDENVVTITDTKRPTVSIGAGPENHWFKPQAIIISAGTTVTWAWTGEGGSHNVVCDGPAYSFDSGQPQKTGKFKHTFSKRGNAFYLSDSDKPEKMRGAIGVVPSDPQATR